MKTILIAHNYSEVSFATMSFNLAHHLANEGHQVIFISHQPYFPEIKNIKKGRGEITICSWPTQKRPTSLRDFFWYAKIHMKYKPDVVIGHFVGSNISISCSKFLSFGKTKTIEYYHTLTQQLLSDQRKSPLKQWFFSFRKKVFYRLFCEVIVCPSMLALEDLKNNYYCKNGIVVLNPMSDRFVSKKNNSQKAIIISYLGRLDNSKGVLDLINAFSTYKEKFKNSKIILNIAGTGSQEMEIRDLIENNVGIRYFGGLNYDKIDGYLNESHFVIIPSKFDNLPTVGLESMMNQTPLLISRATGLTDYLTDGKECFKFNPTVDGMVALFRRVEEEFDGCNQMGIHARNTFLEKFSMENYCTTFDKMIL